MGANLPFDSDKTDAPVKQKQWFVWLVLANISRKRKPPSNWFLASPSFANSPGRLRSIAGPPYSKCSSLQAATLGLGGAPTPSEISENKTIHQLHHSVMREMLDIYKKYPVRYHSKTTM